jgi:hypothetical protein
MDWVSSISCVYFDYFFHIFIQEMGAGVAQSVYRLGYGLDSPAFEVQQGQKLFFSPKGPEQVQDPHGLLFNGYRALCGRQRLRREANLSPTSSAEVKSERVYALLFPYVSRRRQENVNPLYIRETPITILAG